jgi:predicted lipoprotein with Yx(FWY)xxD motif
MRLFRVALLPVAAVCALTLANPASGDQWAHGPTSKSAAAKTTKLKLASSPYGDVLFGNGYAMYIFTRDDGRKSKCYGPCAKAWPPLRPRDEVVAGSGVADALIGTTKRRDGSKQVTYAGNPLYGYVHDPRGEVLCHDVFEFGGDWLAVLGSGEPAPVREIP